MELMKIENNKISSLELVKEINFFRGQEDPTHTILQHKSLL